MIKIILSVLMLHGYYAFSQSPDEKEKLVVLESINKLFLSLEKKDTLLYSSIVLPGGQIWTVRRINDTLKTSMRSFTSDKGALIKMNSVIEERPLSYEITIHNDIAIAWVPYTLSLSGTFSHCGVDIFTLIKTIHGWKIVSLVYSVEPDGCEPLKK
jgi:hypothetical protein